MRTLIQRVQHASVTIDGQLKSKIGKGLLVLVGIEDRDTQEDIEWLCKKIANLRIFDDEEDGYQLVEYEDAKGICYRGWMEK